MNDAKRLKILNCFKYNNNKPITELYFTSDFQLLIAVMLSSQTTDINVNKVTKNLFRIIKYPKDILLMGINELKFRIKSIGLYNIKSNNIFNTCKILLDKYDSKIPSNRNELESFPGVGRKTANIILNTIFKKKRLR